MDGFRSIRAIPPGSWLWDTTPNTQRRQQRRDGEAVAQPYVKDLLGTSEIVLIETRQHWMAAIRFALRPIIIALIGVGLLFLNSLFEFNDDQFLSFINDLITWAVVILFLISIVWIPIDLIRWDSRRYVLTNRRAMRVEGVLQKNSIDSSLEQVTDIGMRETTFGRFLGYADLTLYTASEAANEEYEQLLDGKQFKIAVLDAKEAIRLGGSMDKLADDFVVKGGTNVASMRADGKIEDEQQPEPAVAPAAAPAPDTPVEPPPPAPAAEPAPPPAVAAAPAAAAHVPEPEPAPEPEPEPEPVSAPEPVAEPALVVEPEPEPEPAPAEPASASEPAATDEPAAETAATEAAWPEADTAPAGESEAEAPSSEEPESEQPSAADESKPKDDGPATV